jgi:hypothetical protein
MNSDGKVIVLYCAVLYVILYGVLDITFLWVIDIDIDIALLYILYCTVLYCTDLVSYQFITTLVGTVQYVRVLSSCCLVIRAYCTSG